MERWSFGTEKNSDTVLAQVSGLKEEDSIFGTAANALE
jgi:hypothetical protein